jgi:hypothetical protein
MQMKQRFLIMMGFFLVVGSATLPWVTVCRAADNPAAGKGGAEKIAVEYDFKNLGKKVTSAPAPVTAAPAGEVSVIKNADNLSADLNMTRERNRLISIILLLTGLIVSLYFVLHFIRKTGCGADDIVHAAGLVLIIFGTIIIVLMIDAESQLTAAIGVMGAIAGYLFGSLRRGKEEKTPPASNPQNAGPAGDRPPGKGDERQDRAAEGAS